MKRILLFVISAVFFLCGCSAPAEGGINVHNAWMRPTAQGGNGAVYFVLQNYSAKTDELVSVSSNVAESVEIHESSMVEDTDVMQMKQIFSVKLDGGSETAFEPGGLHVMLVNVNRSLAVGENIELTLHFKNHEDLPVTVSVKEFAPADEHAH